jgi:hypothetical protein
MKKETLVEQIKVIQKFFQELRALRGLPTTPGCISAYCDDMETLAIEAAISRYEAAKKPVV